ncbi:hypothetical protein [Tunicatimonas pelagia]|uniref:hypothetical protein n=1 Tax=Tunicatimonas pelagia TaxID=931531 RepID=UPI00266613BD|nr:hypothetical protein [Tunicatimonas pelagia]WKN46174.1 hypothetical protein P0M28_14570 [Tunicatimonas pelagia]
MKTRLNLLSIISGIVVLASCGEIREQASEKWNLLDDKVEKLDSVINYEIEKVEQLDSIINYEMEKVNKLDSLIEDKSARVDSLLQRN